MSFLFHMRIKYGIHVAIAVLAFAVRQCVQGLNQVGRCKPAQLGFIGGHLCCLLGGWGGAGLAGLLEPSWLQILQLVVAGIWNRFAPLADCTLGDVENSGKGCSASGEVDGVFSFHAINFSTLNI